MATERAELVLVGSALAAASKDSQCDSSAAGRLARLGERLTETQRLFCEQYVELGDAETSYRLAYGFSGSAEALRIRAYALLDKWWIREYMSAICESENIDAVLCTRAEVIHSLKDMMANGTDRERVKAAELLLSELRLEVEGGAPSMVNITVNGGGGVDAAGITKTKISQLRAKVLGLPASNYSVATEKDSGE